MNIALLLMIPPPSLADEFFNTHDKCVISGTVIETEIKTRENTCFDDINLIVKNNLGLYRLNGSIITENNVLCVGGGTTFNQENYPKEGEIIDYIVYDGRIGYYNILSTIKLYDGVYEIPYGTISENNFNVCEPNIKPIQKEIIFEDINNNFVIAKNIKNYYEIFINGSFIINSNTLSENSIKSTEILKDNKNGEIYINEINKILSSFKLEKLILAFKNFSKIDINNVEKYKEILNYIGYQLGIEIFRRNDIN